MLAFAGPALSQDLHHVLRPIWCRASTIVLVVMHVARTGREFRRAKPMLAPNLKADTARPLPLPLGDGGREWVVPRLRVYPRDSQNVVHFHCFAREYNTTHKLADDVDDRYAHHLVYSVTVALLGPPGIVTEGRRRSLRIPKLDSMIFATALKVEWS